MQKSKTYLSSPYTSQTVAASNLTASNPLSTLKTTSNLLTFTERLTSPEDFAPVMQKLGQKPSVFVFCGIYNFEDILLKYMNALGNCCFRCGMFSAFGTYELSQAEQNFVRYEYEYFRESKPLTEQLAQLRNEFIAKLTQRQARNQQIQSYYLTVIDVVQLNATSCRQTICVNAESDEDVLAIVQFLYKYYCFGDMEMYKYSGFLEQRKVKFQDMYIYNQLSGIEGGSDYFSGLVLTRTFHIFTEILQNEELLTKISTLRDCACIQQKPQQHRFDQVGIKQFQRAIRGDFTLKYIVCKNNVLRFSTEVVDECKNENSIALCDDVAEYIKTINDIDDLEAVELDTQEKYIVNLRERTDQLILRLRKRLEYSYNQLSEVKYQYEDNIKQSAAKLSKVLAKSDKIEAQLYGSIMKNQVYMAYQLEKQLAQQEFVQLELDRPDLLFSTPDGEIYEYTRICDKVQLDMPQESKVLSRVQQNQQADRLDLVLRSQQNAKKQTRTIQAAISTETAKIASLKSQIADNYQANEAKERQLQEIKNQRKGSQEMLRFKQLLLSYTKFIQMYQFESKMSPEAQQWWARHQEFYEKLRTLTGNYYSDTPETRETFERLRQQLVKFLQGKQSLSYYGRLCYVCQKIYVLAEGL